MDNIILGKIDNDGKTCSWPLPGREAETIHILENLQKSIPKELLDNIKNSSIVNIKSKSLYQWALETSLSLECVDKDINVLMIAEDIKTGEVTHICHTGESDDQQIRIDRLIKMLDKVSRGNITENNEPIANEIFTIIANVCAAYCAQSVENLGSFMKVVEYYTNLIKENTKVKETQN